MIGLPYGEKNYDDMLSRFHTIPACHGQTDRRTELLYQYRVSVLTRDNNWMWLTVTLLQHKAVVSCISSQRSDKAWLLAKDRCDRRRRPVMMRLHRRPDLITVKTPISPSAMFYGDVVCVAPTSFYVWTAERYMTAEYKYRRRRTNKQTQRKRRFQHSLDGRCWIGEPVLCDFLGTSVFIIWIWCWYTCIVLSFLSRFETIFINTSQWL